MSFLYPQPPPLHRRQSRRKQLIELCVNSLHWEQHIIFFFFVSYWIIITSLPYENLSEESGFKQRRNKNQPRSKSFETESRQPTLGQSCHLPFRWHSTICFSIDNIWAATVSYYWFFFTRSTKQNQPNIYGGKRISHYSMLNSDRHKFIFLVS